MAESAVLEAGPSAIPSGPLPDPSPQGAESGESAESGLFSAMDKAAGVTPVKPLEKPKDVPKVKDVPKPEPAKKDPEIKAQEAKKEEQKPDATKTPAETKAPEAPKGKLSDVLHAKEKRVKELEARVKELETAPAKAAEDPEKAAIIKERDTLRKRAAELEENIKYVDYTKSDEFKKNYEQPYIDTYHRLARIAQELVVVGEDGAKRTLTETEYSKVVTAATEDEAIAIADELFPESHTKASRLVDMRDAVKTAFDRMNSALQEFRTKGGEREQQRQLKASEDARTQKEQFEKERAAVAESDPALFKAGEDEKENAIRAAAEKVAEEAFEGTKTDVKRDAKIWHAIVSFPILKIRYKQSLATIEELKGKLEAFEKSVPEGGQAPPGKEAPVEDDIFGKIDKAAASR